MFEPKHFSTLLIMLLAWKITLCKSNNSTKFNLIKPREIFYEGKIVSINSLMEKNEFPDSTDTSKYPNLLYSSTKCMYADTIVHLLQTFFEIFVYGVNSHTKIDIPDVGERTKNWLISAIGHFNDIKTPVAKTIDDLFFHSDEITVLRTSDQSLLKSLLSINLFLNYSKKNSPFIVFSNTVVTNDRNESAVYTIDDVDLHKTVENVRALNTSIIQMIGLVERFRSKKCLVQNPYLYNFVVNEAINDTFINDVDNVGNLLQPFLNRLNVLINNGSDNYDNFNSNKYDPEYLLFEKLLVNENSFLGNLQINFNGDVSTLKSVFNDEKTIYNIEHILELQHILLKVIADVFYIQIYNLSRNTLNGITDLNNLHSTFENYVSKMLPSNCLMNVCNKILKAQVCLDQALKSYNVSKDSSVFLALQNRFEPKMNVELIIQNSLQDIADPSLSFLFRNIWNDTQHESFRQVINLLSYESYSNTNFYIVKVSDNVGITSSRSFDTEFVLSMIELQYSLIAFWTLLKMKKNDQLLSNNIIHYSTVDLSDLSAIGFTTPKNDDVKKNNNIPKVKCLECEEYEPIFGNMIRVIVKFYNYLGNKPSVQNILLPLLIHFQHTDEHYVQTSDYELIKMLQITFLTINSVENYLINNYSFAFYSLFLYTKFIMTDQNGPDSSKLRYDIQTYAETSEISFRDFLKFLNDLYDVNSYIKFFPVDDKLIEFFWDGSKQFGDKIYQNTVKGVIDYNDLIKLQWFRVKWFISNILLKIMNALMILKQSKSEEIFTLVKSKLNEILILEFPKSIKIFLDNVVNATLTMLSIEWTNLNDNTETQWKTLFANGLAALDAYPLTYEPSSSEIQIIVRDITSEIEQMMILPRLDFLRTQNILISTDLCLSPAENKFSREIIKILHKNELELP